MAKVVATDEPETAAKIMQVNTVTEFDFHQGESSLEMPNSFICQTLGFTLAFDAIKTGCVGFDLKAKGSAVELKKASSF